MVVLALCPDSDLDRQRERNYHQLLLDDVDPPDGVAFADVWRTTSTTGLAAAMYESRDFSALPILADALEDAGCDAAEVLAHCRGFGPHVLGCWAVDLVL